MLKLLAFAIGIALAAFLICRGVAAADPIVTDLRIDAPERLTVGDHLRYVIKVEADEGTQVTLAPGALPEELVLTKAPATSTRRLAGGRVEITLTAEVAPFVIGQLDVGPLRLRFKDAAGASGEIETPGSVLLIESILPDSGELVPRDLKPQVEIGAPAVAWPVVAFAAALVALASVVGLIVLRRRALRRPPVRVAPAPEPVAAGPEDRARAVLDRAGSEFDSEHDYAAYYAAIGVTVRDLLTERYGFPAFALTTRELQQQMTRRGMDRWLARVAVGLLSQCDSVVYAHYRPAAERADADLTAAYEIVEVGRPAALEPEEVAVP